MKHLILGTAGHVDHGKTALVKALTGIECDTHPQEKQRGITINLGFAHLALPSGDTLSIVDVPGHRDFVHTMVSGASAIDIALLVVAADESVMPQTREHVQIMQILGIRRGLIALNKVDAADEETRLMAIDEIVETVAGTFLEGAPIVGVSARTGEGVDDLNAAIGAMASSVDSRAAGETFRMYIDRIFSVAGFGTVVTGSVLGGAIGAGSTAFLLPGSRQLRVRRIERHGEVVEAAVAGDRASLNLVGLDKADFRRGMLVADRRLRHSRMLDARLRLFGHSRKLGLWSQIVFLLGTFEAQARLHLIDRDSVRGGEEALVQIELPAACVAQSGDRFVIRSSSSDVTLGGGEIIDATPLHHRRRTPSLLTGLSRIAEGKLPELVAQEVRKSIGPRSLRDIADALNVTPAQADRVLSGALPEGIRVVGEGGARTLIDASRYGRLTEVTLRRLASFHASNPLRADGLTVDELLGGLGLSKQADDQHFLRCMLEELAAEGRTRAVGRTWTLAAHNVTVDPRMQQQIAGMEAFLKGCDMQAPVPAEQAARAASLGIDEKRLVQILRFLVNTGVAHEVEGFLLHASVVDTCRDRLLTELSRRPEGLTVAQFRDVVGGNRKICLLLYALFDVEGVTERSGDVRVITAKGRAMVEGAGQ